MGGGTVLARLCCRHVFHGYALCRLSDVGIVDSRSLLARPGLPCKCVEAAETRDIEHGYSGVVQYRHSISVQCVQSVFSRILAVQGHRTACLFRIFKRYHSIHIARTLPGGTCQSEYFRSCQETYGTASEDRQDSRRGRIQGGPRRDDKSRRYPGCQAGRAHSRGRHRD